ncbi:PA24C phospholipase, partial [Amia calva]|nr:PA24C phospholipase [Amia calva]
PQIAVLGSGGGLRAMLALMGTLSELGAQNLLDSILYLCGVSGSTWCMSSLYKEKDWSSRVEEREKEMVETLTTGYVTLMSKWDRVLKAVKDENYSLTDIWTGKIVYDIVKKVKPTRLSDETMVNPYPIFAVVDKWRLDHKEEHDKGVWFEITRHEAGYPGYGAFVDTSVFGSRFKAGEITERKEEMDMLYLQGLCGSTIGDMKMNMKEIQIRCWASRATRTASMLLAQILRVSGLYWRDGTPGTCRSGDTRVLQATAPFHSPALFSLKCHICPDHPSSDLMPRSATRNLDHTTPAHQQTPPPPGPRCPFVCFSHCPPTRLYMLLWNTILPSSFIRCFDDGGENKALLSNMKDSWDQKNEEEQADLFLILEMTIRVTINSPKLLKILSNWIWGTKFNFLHEFSSREDDLPSVLVQDEKIYLVDAGLANNCGYPLVLRPDRQVQLILSFDFSAGDPFLTVHQAAEYCKKNNIPFPDIPVVSEEEKDNPSDCYIYSGENTPTVMHFPLFNKANCGGQFPSLIPGHFLMISYSLVVRTG